MAWKRIFSYLTLILTWGLLFLSAPILKAQEIQQIDPFYLDLFQKAQKSFLARNYKDAIRDFQVAVFGLVGDQKLRAKSYVYLSLSYLHLQDTKNCEKYLRDAADLLGNEGFETLEIFESAWPDLDKILNQFKIGNSQKEPPIQEVEKPKKIDAKKANPNPEAKKPEQKDKEKKSDQKQAKNKAEQQTSQEQRDSQEQASDPVSEGASKNFDPDAKINLGDVIPLRFVDVPPLTVKRFPAVYPPQAFRLKVEATVTINALISETGDVIKTEIIKGVDGPLGFNQAGEIAVQKWKFQPASKKGIKVKVWMPINIEFKVK